MDFDATAKKAAKDVVQDMRALTPSRGLAEDKAAAWKELEARAAMLIKRHVENAYASGMADGKRSNGISGKI
jgi:hypothetical protein